MPTIRLAALALFGLSLAVAALPVSAQGNLLDRAKGAMQGMGSGVPGAGGLGSAEIAAGLREALKVGTERVVGQVGVTDGFNSDPAIHIPLPGALKKVQSVLKTAGMSDLADDLELRMNRAAEAAAPEAKTLFWNAISEMTLDDAEKILNGPDDAATRYFQRKMTPPLARRMSPVVDRTLADVGAVQSYDRMMAQYKAVPFVPDAKANLTEYVVGKAMDGIFHYVAVEEAAIRHDPAKRTTALLQKVFAGK